MTVSANQPAIALVDDDYHSARLMTRMLEAHGGPELAMDPEAAVDRLVGASDASETAGRFMAVVDLDYFLKATRDFVARLKGVGSDSWSWPWRRRSTAKSATSCSKREPPRSLSVISTSRLLHRCEVDNFVSLTLWPSGSAIKASMLLALRIPQTQPSVAGSGVHGGGGRPSRHSQRPPRPPSARLPRAVARRSPP